MNSNQPKLDPMTLQRLIDGELDTQQVQEILSQAQASPDQWESIAVGFIENQTWDKALTSKFAQPIAGSDTTEASCPEKPDSSSRSGNTLDTAAVTLAADDNGGPQSQRRTSIRWWAIAASLMAAAAIGYMTNQIQNRNLPSTSIAESKPINDLVVPAQPELTATALVPDFHVEIPQAAGFGRLDGQDSNGRVPVYRVTNTDQLRQLQAKRAIESAFPRQIMEQLSNSGYQIEQEIEYVSGQVDDQSFVVPLRTIRLIPGQ